MHRCYAVALLLLICFATYAGSQRYFLCGPDEDGCSPDYYTACLCIPHDEAWANQPYCLDFNKLACVPLALSPTCARTDIFKNQSDCIATAFQSEPEPACEITSAAFCQEHLIPTCAQDGGIHTCVPQPGVRHRQPLPA